VDRGLLYGSYARDEPVPGSDIDLAILVDERHDDDRKRVQEIAGDWFVDRGLRVSPRVFETAAFRRKVEAGYGFHSNVAAEGVPV